MPPNSSGKKVANRVVGASCAAVLAVYAAGYERTQSAANRLSGQISERRRATARAPLTESPVAAVREMPPLIAAPAPPAALPESVPAVVAKIRRSAPNSSQVDDYQPPWVTAPKTEPVAASPSAQVTAPPPVIATPIAVAPPVAPAAPPPVAPVAATVWKDGTYTGWGYSRHGNIEASVVIEGGRILSASISQCRTRYSCSVIEALPPQVAQRQSALVDYVSGATQSADAFYGAVLEALAKAK